MTEETKHGIAEMLVLAMVGICIFAISLFIGIGAALSAETCIASHYGVGDGYGGKRTASGERMDPHAMTAAHPTLHFGSMVLVTNLENGRKVWVRINDRGPFVPSRCIDLSYGAAQMIGMIGSARVRVQ
jgi:rare lipoprotein A